MLLSGMRFSILTATPLFILCVAYMDGVIRMLTGVKQPTAPMFWSGELLVFWYYSLVLTHGVFKTMFMMAGQEKRMMIQGVSEAAANLILSIGLTLGFKRAFGVEWGILGVALGSVIPTFVFGWGLIWGWAAHEAQLTRFQLFKRLVLQPWLGCLPMVYAAALLRLQPFWASGSNSVLVIAEGAVVGVVGLWGIWCFSLNETERANYGAKFRRKFGPKPIGLPV
jgi:hypothetical protein